MGKKKENKETSIDAVEYYNITMNILFSIISEPYYLFHFLSFFSYFSIRLTTSHLFSAQFTQNLLHRELQAVVAFLTLSVVKMVKEETWDGFIADMLRGFSPGTLVHADILSYISLYTATCLHGTRRFNTINTPAVGNFINRRWRIKILVEFRSSFSSSCIRTSRILPELSITFSNKNISFGVVDLGLFPNTAERFGISLGVPDQLPTYILFENAEEISRFPEMNSSTKSSDITKKRLCRHFELDKHLLDYIGGK
ncbi:hypothetical protein M8C21_010006 [Ambrosia artemisiifolia]|uniref:Thioredoxin-related transmembrane protein 2 n=1 Tax=Ambrosia artemisiifolia TaxID=4212 RepID=A0AAD5CBZ9_AMBAR|nr:hypothetical protein M8C21_010006 [Ambrosia artemisiifolia]